MPIDFDPYDDSVMSDSWPAYSRLREESPVHYIEKYDCWALARFEDVWEALLNHEVFTAIQGVSPGQILLHEPVPPTFMTMDLPEHRRYRSLIGQDYTRKTVAGYEGKIRALTREILAPLLTAGAFDVYADLANRVATLFIGGLIGIPRDEIEPLRALVSRFFHREFEQVGTSEKNAEVGALLNQQIAAIVTRRRASAERGGDHISVWIDAVVDGRRLSDEDIVANVFSILVTGAETVPLAVANTIYYLAESEADPGAVLADPSLIPHAYAESIRYDQPTNILGRRLSGDIEIRGQRLQKGQGVLFLYASANRDEAEFDRADVFDIHRRPRRSLSFGHGIHKCLGDSLGFLEGRIILEELLAAVGRYRVERKGCRRVYGEFLSGYHAVPIAFELPTKGLSST